jgi:hypothetical protein
MNQAIENNPYAFDMSVDSMSLKNYIYVEDFEPV